MNVIQRRQRRAELNEIRCHDPLRVVEMYRRIVGLNRTNMLPGGMDFDSLIESILEHETASGNSLE